MSGAEPWIGSYRPTRPSPSDADGSRPSEPASIEASSVRMSPNMFSVTITSYSRGLASRCIAIESTSWCSSVMSGNSSRTTRVDHFAPQARGLQHVGLVDRGEPAAAPRASAQARRIDALDLGDAVFAQVAGGIVGRAALLLAEVDAAGEFAHHDQVDAVQQVRLDRRGAERGRVRLHRAQVGVQAQRLADRQQALFGTHRAPSGRTTSGPPTAPSSTASARCRGGERSRRQRFAGGVDRGAADQRVSSKRNWWP